MPRHKKYPVPDTVPVEVVVWSDHFSTSGIPLNTDGGVVMVSVGFNLLETDKKLVLGTTFKTEDDKDLTDANAEVDSIVILKADILHRQTMGEFPYGDLPDIK